MTPREQSYQEPLSVNFKLLQKKTQCNIVPKMNKIVGDLCATVSSIVTFDNISFKKLKSENTTKKDNRT